MSRDFDGTTSLINMQSPAVLDNAEPFTIAFWAALDGLGEGGSGHFVSKTSAQTSGTGRWTFLIRKGGGQATTRFVKSFGTTNLTRQGSGGFIRTDGTFQHLALTWTGSIGASSVLIYTNGVEDAVYSSTIDGAGTRDSDAASAFTIGNVSNGTRALDGRMAHIHFFRRVLSVNEIRQLMYHPASSNAGPAVANTSGLAGYWPCWGMAENEPDLSGTGNAGTVTSAPFNAQMPSVNETYVATAPGSCAY